MSTKNIVEFNSAEEFNDASLECREKFFSETHEPARVRSPGATIGSSGMCLVDCDGFSVVWLRSDSTENDLFFAVETEEAHAALDAEIESEEERRGALRSGDWGMVEAYIAAGEELAYQAGLLPTETDYDE